MSWLRRQWDAIKGNALWDLVKAIVAALFLSFGGTKLLDASLAKVPWVAISLVGLYLFISAFRRRQSASKKSFEPVGVGMLKPDVLMLLRNYKKLDYDHRQEVRLPLAHSSWPGFDNQWSYIQVSLYTYATMLNLLRVKAKALWMYKERKDDPPLFDLPDSALMYQVIEGLQDLNKRLDEMLPDASKWDSL